MALSNWYDFPLAKYRPAYSTLVSRTMRGGASGLVILPGKVIAGETATHPFLKDNKVVFRFAKNRNLFAHNVFLSDLIQ